LLSAVTTRYFDIVSGYGPAMGSEGWGRGAFSEIQRPFRQNRIMWKKGDLKMGYLNQVCPDCAPKMLESCSPECQKLPAEQIDKNPKSFDLDLLKFFLIKLIKSFLFRPNSCYDRSRKIETGDSPLMT